FVQREPWLERDLVMIDILKSVGIEKGKPFAPDAKSRKILEDAIHEAHAWLEWQYETMLSTPYFQGTHWGLPAPEGLIKLTPTAFVGRDTYPFSDRGFLYSYIFFSPKRLGTGQFYLVSINDKDGRSYQGDNPYRLHVPPNAPVALYWSVTVYDRATHALIRD